MAPSAVAVVAAAAAAITVAIAVVVAVVEESGSLAVSLTAPWGFCVWSCALSHALSLVPLVVSLLVVIAVARRSPHWPSESE